MLKLNDATTNIRTEDVLSPIWASDLNLITIHLEWQIAVALVVNIERKKL